jgi:hypothetical protein
MLPKLHHVLLGTYQSDDDGVVEVPDSEDDVDAKVKDVSPKAEKDGNLKDEKAYGKKKTVKQGKVHR